MRCVVSCCNENSNWMNFNNVKLKNRQQINRIIANICINMSQQMIKWWKWRKRYAELCARWGDVFAIIYMHHFHVCLSVNTCRTFEQNIRFRFESHEFKQLRYVMTFVIHSCADNQRIIHAALACDVCTARIYHLIKTTLWIFRLCSLFSAIVSHYLY